jgi:hypothetical protein
MGRRRGSPLPHTARPAVGGLPKTMYLRVFSVFGGQDRSAGGLGDRRTIAVLIQMAALPRRRYGGYAAAGRLRPAR